MRGIESVRIEPLLAAVAIGMVATVCCAWRWTVVANGLGVGMSVRTAIPAYYRSQFLNATLPGGVLGDVHRGLHHGRQADDVRAGLRAVAWERSAGQILQGAVTAGVLLGYSSPVPAPVSLALISIVAMAVLSALALSRLPGSGSSRSARVLRTLRADVRQGLLSARSWPVVVAASLIVVAGHTATFVIAARTAGIAAPLHTVIPLGMVVLVAAAVPLNIAGWGLREGAAAWAFAGAGLGASGGIAASTAFGVLTLATALPGVVVLVIFARRTTRPTPVAAPHDGTAAVPVTAGSSTKEVHGG